MRRADHLRLAGLIARRGKPQMGADIPRSPEAIRRVDRRLEGESRDRSDTRHAQSAADTAGRIERDWLRRSMKRTFYGKSANEADQQLSFRYGHLPRLLSRSGAMDRTFWKLET